MPQKNHPLKATKSVLIAWIITAIISLANPTLHGNPTQVKSPAIQAAKAFHTTFPTCGKSLSMPIFPPLNETTETNYPAHTVLIEAAQYFQGNKKIPERFEIRKVQYEGSKYIKTLLEEEIYWIGKKSEWNEKQKKTFKTLITEIKKVAQNPQSNAYVGRLNFEPEVNSYFYCEISPEKDQLHIEIFQRCD